jgi:hypothetical protein
VYTGHQGRDPNTGTQIADQELTHQNLALAVSCQRGLPVRVIRGSELDSPYAPKSGYRYDGLYQVESYWHETGAAGFRIWRFRLVRQSADPFFPGRRAPLPALLDGSGLLMSRELPQMHKPRFATRPGPRRCNSFPTRRE